jgi:hypothetical protein
MGLYGSLSTANHMEALPAPESVDESAKVFDGRGVVIKV